MDDSLESALHQGKIRIEVRVLLVLQENSSSKLVEIGMPKVKSAKSHIDKSELVKQMAL